MSTLWLWEIHFFSLQHRAWFCQTDCRGRPYLLLQTGRGKQLIKISHFSFLSVVVFFSSKHEYIMLEFFWRSFYKQWRYICKQMNLLQCYYCIFWYLYRNKFLKVSWSKEIFPDLLNCNYHFLMVISTHIWQKYIMIFNSLNFIE